MSYRRHHTLTAIYLDKLQSSIYGLTNIKMTPRWRNANVVICTIDLYMCVRR